MIVMIDRIESIYHMNNWLKVGYIVYYESGAKRKYTSWAKLPVKCQEYIGYCNVHGHTRRTVANGINTRIYKKRA